MQTLPHCKLHLEMDGEWDKIPNASEGQNNKNNKTAPQRNKQTPNHKPNQTNQPKKKKNIKPLLTAGHKSHKLQLDLYSLDGSRFKRIAEKL